MTEEKLKELLNDMSLEEKINQLVQIPGSYYEKEAVVTGGMQSNRFSEKQLNQAGSILGISGAETLREIQKNYMEKQPHHIPLLFMLDVIHGLRTIFPMPLALGATFDEELVKSTAQAAASETAVSGVHVTFAPMADLVRDARWGRVMESTGEDPYLNSILAEAMVSGFQGAQVKGQDSIAACVKHFAAYGAPEGGREYNNVELSEHTLREYYLPAYEAGIRAGSELVMTSFNTLNGIPSSGNQWLLRDVLRKEMGFDGVVISDWASIEEMIPHGFCADKREAAKKAIEAGVDIDMCTDVYANNLQKLVEDGEIDERRIDESVLRVLRLKNRLGLFENPFKDGDAEREKEVILCSKHRKLAREAAKASFVLLKNEKDIQTGKKLLPIEAKARVAFIGPYAESKELHSAWAIKGEAEDAVSIREAAEEALGRGQAVFAQGCGMLQRENSMNLSRNAGHTLTERELGIYAEEEEKQMEEALRAAKSAEVVVLCLGEHRLMSGEAASRADIKLPKIQLELFRKIQKVNPRIVTVVFSGRPLDLREVSEKSMAVLEVWLPGTEGGHAILDVLTGEYNPSGKLPMSFPYSVGQVPVYYNGYATGRPKMSGEEGLFYRSKYLDIPNEPLYPFGYGLSYTEFEISKTRLSAANADRDNPLIKVSATVKNTEKRSGTETMQLYIQDISASVVRPVKELKGICKVTLEPGEERNVEFQITEEMLCFHNMDNKLAREAGSYRVWVSNSSITEDGVEFVIE
ncbi:beta-glucosidase BglX [Konateibacter massiliensis]|uniref:beta-glucosidase BglX n=1 Tax=Konateibacter massiliensis TaxID=2002841 RepID=UPI000C159EA2|nr:beta-glucosidase BglX [Konateibacter massiliensis]